MHFSAKINNQFKFILIKTNRAMRTIAALLITLLTCCACLAQQSYLCTCHEAYFIRTGDTWCEYRSQGLWNTYSHKRETQKYYYIANESREVAIPKSRTSNVLQKQRGQAKWSTFCTTVQVYPYCPEQAAQLYAFDNGFWVKDGNQWRQYSRTGTQVLAYTQYDQDNDYYYLKSSNGPRWTVPRNLNNTFCTMDGNGHWVHHDASLMAIYDGPSGGSQGSLAAVGGNEKVYYTGPYTETGKSADIATGRFADSGLSALHQVKITSKGIEIDGRTTPTWKTAGEWIYYGSNDGEPVYLYNPKTGDLRWRFVLKVLGITSRNDNFWFAGDVVAQNTGHGTAPAGGGAPAGGSAVSSADRQCEFCGGSGRCSWVGSIYDREYCHGSGTCGHCNGRGYVTNPYGGRDIECSFCNHTGRCGYCHGSGRCSHCGGTGHR